MGSKLLNTEPLSTELPRQRKRSSLFMFMGSFVALCLTTFFHLRPQFKPNHVQQDIDSLETWSWNNVKPDRDLKWEQCYDGFECARLDVPMDWLDPTDDERVLIGVIKLAAKRKGAQVSPVFVNPGGPGGSGVTFLLKAGRLLQTIVGDNHDIISFDPRGVGVSTPRVECWGSSQKRKIWTLQDTHVVDERPGLIYDAYARSVAYSGVCEAAMNETGILRHLSTPSLARDMLEILTKSGNEKLRYWGFSYGTVLGGVFAGLYPERVERLVSDGNCDYRDWFTLDHTNFLSDTDSILDAFDEACYKAGPDSCAFWSKSPEAIQRRRSDLLDQLKASPIILPVQLEASGSGIPHVITYSHIQRLVQVSIYKPLAFFPNLAHVFASLERGDGEPFLKMSRKLGGEKLQAGELCSLDDTPATTPLETSTELDAFPAIMCSDGEQLTETPQEFEKYVQKITGISRWAGAANVHFRLSCIGKNVRPKWRISEGDFKRDTAHPILFIGNKADNVTPLQSAFNNSARFPGSVVLKQNSYGHCSLAAASTCTARYIRAYFQEGKLPEPGTECEPDYDLFEVPEKGKETVTQDELSEAVMRLFQEVNIPRGKL